MSEQDVHKTGLKVRRQDIPTVQKDNKPRKMTLLKPKRKKTTVPDYANSALLVFPSDKLGITTELKAALIRAASRVNKSKEGIALIKEVIDIGLKHIEARYEQNTKSCTLKRRGAAGEPLEVEPAVPTKEVSEDVPANPQLELALEEVSYEDMLSFLKDSGIKPHTRKKEDVLEAYNAAKDGE